MFKKNKGNMSTGTGTTARAGGVAKLASAIPLLLLALAAWATTIAGLAVVRHAVGEGGSGAVPSLDFTWFVVFGTLFVLLAALIHLVGVGFSVLPIGHAAIAGLLAVFTVLCMLQTDSWNQARKATPYTDQFGKGVVTTFAGFISLSVLLSLLIIALGNQSTAIRRDTTTDNYATTTNPTATGVAEPGYPHTAAVHRNGGTTAV